LSTGQGVFTKVSAPRKKLRRGIRRRVMLRNLVSSFRKCDVFHCRAADSNSGTAETPPARATKKRLQQLRTGGVALRSKIVAKKPVSPNYNDNRSRQPESWTTATFTANPKGKIDCCYVFRQFPTIPTPNSDMMPGRKSSEKNVNPRQLTRSASQSTICASL